MVVKCAVFFIDAFFTRNAAFLHDLSRREQPPDLFALLGRYLRFVVVCQMLGEICDVSASDCVRDLSVVIVTVRAHDLQLSAEVFVQLDSRILSPSYDHVMFRHNVTDEVFVYIPCCRRRAAPPQR